MPIYHEQWWAKSFLKPNHYSSIYSLLKQLANEYTVLCITITYSNFETILLWSFDLSHHKYMVMFKNTRSTIILWVVDFLKNMWRSNWSKDREASHAKCEENAIQELLSDLWCHWLNSAAISRLKPNFVGSTYMNIFSCWLIIVVIW